MKLAKSVILILMLIALNLNVLSQKNDAPIEVKTNVLVWNSEGMPTSDIKQEDLKIYEDGIEQKISYFIKKEDILNLGLVLDNSGSLRHALETEIVLAKGFVRNLVRKDEAFLVRFVDTGKIQIVQDWTSNQKILNKKIDDLFVEGGQTAIIDATYTSVEKILAQAKKDKLKRYALILITDGEDRDSYYKESQLYDLLKNSDVQIFPVVINQQLETTARLGVGINPRQRATDFVNRLALNTGGTTFFVNYPAKPIEFDEGLAQIIKKIANELRSQYIIGYTSTNPLRDGKPRKLTIQIADNEKGEKRQASIREEFTVPKK